MNKDCKKFDECDYKNLSICCGAKIYTDTDLCSDCKEHTDDCCKDCPDYEPEKIDMVQYANNLLKTVSNFNYGTGKA